MKFLAPIVITLLVSGGLYMNREIWSLANYNQSGAEDLSGYSEPGMRQFRARGQGTKQYEPFEEDPTFKLGGTKASPQDLRSESR